MIFHSNPPSRPSSRGILKRCWKQMVTGSNPARSLGSLYSAYQNHIKIQSCFQAHINLSFRSASLWASSNSDHFRSKGGAIDPAVPWCMDVYGGGTRLPSHRRRVEAPQHHTGQGRVWRSGSEQHTHLLLLFLNNLNMIE